MQSIIGALLYILEKVCLADAHDTIFPLFV